MISLFSSRQEASASSEVPHSIPILQHPEGQAAGGKMTSESLTQAQQESLQQLKELKPWLHKPASMMVDQQQQQPDSAFEAFEDLDLPQRSDDYWLQHFEAFCTDACLLRYLRANQWKVRGAYSQLVSTLEWRKRYQPHLITPEEVEPECESGKFYFNGYSKDGCPIAYVRNHLETTNDPKRQIRYLVFALENALNMMPPSVEKTVLLFDFKIFTPTPMNQVKYFLHLVSNHYPERMAYAFGCNGPWYFWVFWKLISPLMQPITREKIRFADISTMTNLKPSEKGVFCNLLNFIDEDVLERDFGGKNNFKYDHSSYWSMFVQRVYHNSRFNKG